MLVELDVRDFAIIEHARCGLEPGFNVLTGETGAGKSLIVDAVGQLLGERADSTLVRAGAERAVVQGVFEPGPSRAAIDALLDSYGVEGGDTLIVAREIHAAGRSTARVNGRVVPARALTELGQHLIDIHGQTETASLKREAEHIELLDRYARLEPERAHLSGRVAETRDVAAELSALQQDEAALARRAEVLAFQVEEIQMARLSEAEEAELLSERTRLANGERLAVLADRAYGALRDESGEGEAAQDLLERAFEAIDALARIDQEMTALGPALTGAVETVAEVATRLLAYRDALEFEPQRLEQVEERLALIADLKRKYAPDVAGVLAFAEAAAEELERLTGSEARIAELEAQREALRTEVGALAGEVSARRWEAGERLARAVEEELEALGMAGSRFEVALDRREDPDGVPIDGVRYAFDQTGIDRVAFQVSTNPGEPPLPLVRVASGGETARLMLALKTVLSAADQVPSLIFDEIDAGIGGRIGGVVGRKLWGLSERHQVLCVTHLPQVAAYGDTHLQVRKSVAEGRTVTEIARIDEAARVDEVMHMHGSGTNIARENAIQLLQRSELWKVTQRRSREMAG